MELNWAAGGKVQSWLSSTSCRRAELHGTGGAAPSSAWWRGRWGEPRLHSGRFRQPPSACSTKRLSSTTSLIHGKMSHAIHFIFLLRDDYFKEENTQRGKSCKPKVPWSQYFSLKIIFLISRVFFFWLMTLRTVALKNSYILKYFFRISQYQYSRMRTSFYTAC